MSQSRKERWSSPPPLAQNPFADLLAGQPASAAPAPETAQPVPASASRLPDPQPGVDRLLRGQSALIALDRKRRRGKTVTTIAGIHLAPRDLDDLARRLRQHCGAGGAVDGDLVEIQGDQRDRVQAFLTEREVKVRRSGG